MSQNLDEQNGKKHTIRWDGEKCYAWIGDKSIMVFQPNDKQIAGVGVELGECRRAVGRREYYGQ